MDPATPAIRASSLVTEVARLGYLALTKDEFVARISDFYKYQTGVGTRIMLMTVISFIFRG